MRPLYSVVVMIVQRALEADGRSVVIQVPVDRKTLETLEIDLNLGRIYPHVKDKVAYLRGILTHIASLPDGMVAMATVDHCLIGFMAFHPPAPNDIWSTIDGARELGAVEVATEWRRHGIGSALLEASLDTGEFEDKILYFKGLSWHWDLEKTGLSKCAYREMIKHDCERFGFHELSNFDLDVCVDPAGLSMVPTGVAMKDAPSMYITFENLEVTVADLYFFILRERLSRKLVLS